MRSGISKGLKMFKAIWSQLSGYIIAGAGVVVAVFLAIFQYRGAKIDALKDDNETLKNNSDKLDDVIAKKEKELKTRAKVNEILTQDDDAIASAERLRSRARNKNSRGV